MVDSKEKYRFDLQVKGLIINIWNMLHTGLSVLNISFLYLDIYLKLSVKIKKQQHKLINHCVPLSYISSSRYMTGDCVDTKGERN